MSYNYENVVNSIREYRRVAYANVSVEATTATASVLAASAPDLDALQHSMDGFATLSKHCPMTPLLWIQYAHDTEVLMEGLMMLESSTEGGSEKYCQEEWWLLQMESKKSALESSTGILELGLAEFPGCAALQLYYLESVADYVYQSEGLRLFNARNGAIGMEVDDIQANRNKLSSAFECALKSVGKGSHVNEGAIVSEIYRLNGSFLLFLLSAEKKKGVGANEGNEYEIIINQISTLFIEWSESPMGEGSNDEMMQDMEHIWDEACSIILSSCLGDEQQKKRKYDLAQEKATLWANIDVARKKTSSLTNILSSYENEIDVAMSNEGIVLPRQSLFAQQQDQSNSNTNDNVIGNYLQSLRRNNSKWVQVLLSDTNSFLLGLGGADTSRAFLKATKFLQSIYQGTMKKGESFDNTERSSIDDHVVKYKETVICSLYERAISECPTVESVWVSYMTFLRAEWSLLRSNGGQSQREQELSSSLRSTSHRAVRNCPYSCNLFEIRMTTLGMISASNLEPDDITAVVKECSELGFLNHNRKALLHLRLVAILVVTRKLMSRISLGTTTSSNNGHGKDYDDTEEMNVVPTSNRKSSSNGTVCYELLNLTTMEEVQDLIEDIRDMYDEADSYLHGSKTDNDQAATDSLRVAFWKHRALNEAYTLCPIFMALKKAFDNDDENEKDNDVLADMEAIQSFEKLVKSQKPSHPDSWREYIQYTRASHIYLIGRGSNSTQSKPDSIGGVVSTVRTTRGLYNRAMSCVRKACRTTTAPIDKKELLMERGIDGTMFQRDYDAALLDLCREYLAFERNWGSEESFSHAQSLVRSKLANWEPAEATITNTLNTREDLHGKRKLEANGSAFHYENGPSKITENYDENDENENDKRSKRVKVKTNLKQPKMTDGVHRVRIGKLDYPAHPYTIHVSKLSKDIQDMDLVDAFRHEFGAVVHARILREKLTGKGGHHFHGESKCAGLIQFEERSSVEDALRRDGEFKVGEQPVKIQRSHLPAVGVVPPGMHRVNPKGEGKVSKRNKLKKSSVDGMELEVEGKRDDGKIKADGDQKEIHDVASTSSPSSLSFDVLSFKPRAMRQKPKISLDSSNKK
ncbi:hypothetical protein ACHAXA_011805 [Cyclostephanos tholiformis]|uniref:RRM domain-containing protein n=1 Tax=Cyclostephanos tholiformis TaxID=382380 RepID=A0ABD3RAM8_9STRA